MHGEGFGETGLYASSPLTTSIFAFYTLMLNIVMLNALIAIMGDTYDRVSETRVERGLLQRAMLLVELEESMDKDNEKVRRGRRVKGRRGNGRAGGAREQHAPQHLTSPGRSSSLAGCTPSVAPARRGRTRK